MQEEGSPYRDTLRGSHNTYETMRQEDLITFGGAEGSTLHHSSFPLRKGQKSNLQSHTVGNEHSPFTQNPPQFGGVGAL